ncbi:MAG: hypothetical protein ACOC5T_03175 [Elusimicrobiota bacterium]
MRFDEFYKDIEYISGEDNIEPEDAEEAYAIAKKHGISVLSDKDIDTIVKVGDMVAGALWTTWLSDEYSFDVVVKNDFQRMGIGSKLIDIALDSYEFDKEAFGDDAIIRADVINPKMEKILLGKGFEIESKVPGHTMMIRKYGGK